MFLWLVLGSFKVDIGLFIIMMFLKDYLQYETQKKEGKNREAEKQRLWKSRKAGKSRETH